MADYKIVEQALSRGYSMDEIADILGKDSGYDPEEVRANGYSTQEMLGRLGYAAPKAAPKPESDYGDALNLGWEKFKTGMEVPLNKIGLISDETLAKDVVSDNALAASQARPGYLKPIEDQVQAANQADGAGNTAWEIAKLVGTAVTNPKAVGYLISENLANQATSLGGIVGGAVAGGVVGKSPLGVLVGMAGGSLIGNSPEYGGKVIELINAEAQKRGLDPASPDSVIGLLQDRVFRDEAERQGLVKWGTIATVDTISGGLVGRGMSAAERAFALAQKGVLAKAGLEAADDVAIKAAVAANPALKAELKAAHTTYIATQGLKPTVARGVAGTIAEMTTEATGEYLGEGLASGEWKPGDAALEGVIAVGQSVGTAVGTGSAYRDLNRARNIDTTPADVAKAPDVETAIAMADQSTNVPAFDNLISDLDNANLATAQRAAPDRTLEQAAARQAQIDATPDDILSRTIAESQAAIAAKDAEIRSTLSSEEQGLGIPPPAADTTKLPDTSAPTTGARQALANVADVVTRGEQETSHGKAIIDIARTIAGDAAVDQQLAPGFALDTVQQRERKAAATPPITITANPSGTHTITADATVPSGALATALREAGVQFIATKEGSVTTRKTSDMTVVQNVVDRANTMFSPNGDENQIFPDVADENGSQQVEAPTVAAGQEFTGSLPKVPAATAAQNADVQEALGAGTRVILETELPATDNEERTFNSMKLAKDGTPMLTQRTTKRMSKYRAAAISRIAKLFGAKAVFYEGDNSTADGYNRTGTNTIHINVDSGIDALAVAGHEFRHTLKNGFKRQHKAIQAAARAILAQEGRMAKYGAEYLKKTDKEQFAEIKKRLKSGKLNEADNEFLAEEFSADITGNMWRDPAALREVFDAIIEAHPPSVARDIIKSIGDMVLRFIDKLLMSTGKTGLNEMGVSREELVALKTEIKGAMKDAFLQAERTRIGLDRTQNENGGEVKYASPKGASTKKSAEERKNRTLDEVRSRIAADYDLTVSENPLELVTGQPFSSLDSEELGEGLLIKNADAEMRRMMDESISEALLPIDLAQELRPPTAAYVDKAFRLSNGSRFWYELSSTGFAGGHFDLSPTMTEHLIDIVAATSGGQEPTDNLKIGVAAMAQDMQGLPVTVGVRDPSSLTGAMSQAALTTHKFGNFSDTMQLLANLRPGVEPLPTIDLQMAAVFGVRHAAIASNPVMYETICRFLIKLRDAQNAAQPGKQPFESWQNQALLWVAERDTSDPDSYDIGMPKIVAQLQAAGIPAPGGKITVATLMDPRTPEVLSPTTKSVPETSTMTVETRTMLSKTGKSSTEAFNKIKEIQEPWAKKLVREFEAIQRRTMKALGQKQPHPKGLSTKQPGVISQLMSVVMGKTMASYDAARVNTDGWGTFEGDASPNLRVPMMLGQRGGSDGNGGSPRFLLDATQRSQVAAVVGKDMKQKAMASSQFVSVPAGQHDTFSILVKRYDKVDITESEMAEISDGLGRPLNYSSVPNGWLLDVNIGGFDDTAEQKAENRDLARVQKVMQGFASSGAQGYHILHRAYDSDYIDSSAYNKLIKGLENAISRDINTGGGREAGRATQRLSDLTRLREQIQGIYKQQESAFKQWERGAREIATKRGVSFSEPRSDAASSGSVRASPRRSDGKEAVNNVAGVHYSREKRDTLLASMFGTGLNGAELERIKAASDDRLRHRIYFYVNGGRGINPEQGVGAHAHQATLDNLYDLDNDPFDLAIGQDKNLVESRIIDNGYDGVISSERGVAILIGPRTIDVEYAGTGVKPAVSEPEQNAPSEYGAARRAIAANRSLPMGEMKGSDWKRMLPEMDLSHLDDEGRYYKDQLVARPTVKMSPFRAVDTSSPAFLKWFDDSKVVDADGKPLVVYHGTANDVEGFEQRRSNYPSTGGDQGFYFTSEPGTAGVYAEQAGNWTDGGENVMPVYLSLQSPYVRTTKMSPDKFFDYNRGTLMEMAKAKGADGIIVHGDGRSLYIAFRPAQVKSAISNTGEFSDTNPDIRYSPDRVSAEDLNEVLNLLNTTSSDTLGVKELTEDEIQSAETLFLSDFKEGTRKHYGRKHRLARRLRQASDESANDLGGKATVVRRDQGALGPFSGYSTKASVDDDGTFNVEVYGKEQVEEGLDTEPALTFNVTPDGTLIVNGPSPLGKTFKEFEKRGWAERATAGGEVAPGWTRLVGEDGGKIPMEQVINLLGEVHARARLNKRVSHMGLHWQRATGMLGLVDEKGGAAFFSTPRVSSTPLTKVDADEVVAAVERSVGSGLVSINVFPDFASLPQEVKDSAQDSGIPAADFHAVTIRGEIYIAQDQHTSLEDFENTVFHEVYGHLGMRATFGKDIYNKLNDLYLAIGPTRFLELAQKYEVDLKAYGEAYRRQASLASSAIKSRAGGELELRRGALMDELLAHIAGKETGKIQQRAKEILGMVRAWLREHGFKHISHNEYDLANVLRQGRNALKTGTRQDGSMVAFRASTPRVIGASGRAYTAEQEAFHTRVGRTVDDLTTAEKLKKWISKRWVQGIFDQFAPFRAIDKHAYTLMRLSKGATGAFEAFIKHGKLMLNADGSTNADTSGGVMKDVFIPLGKETTDFLYWIAGQRAERLAMEGKERLFTPADIRAAKSLEDGDLDFDYVLASGTTTRNRKAAYKDSLTKFNDYNKNVLDLAEKSGLIDGASRHLWEHEFYVPFYRVMDEKDGGVRGMNIKQGVVRQTAFKKLKGGEEQLNDLLQNTLMNWAHLIDASAKNRAAKAAVEAAELVGLARKAVPNETKTVWFMDGGQKREYKVDDMSVMEAITGLENAGMKGPIMDALAKPKHWLTVGVTASPFFKVRNLIRDSMQAVATSDLSYNVFDNLVKGYQLTNREAQEYVSALAAGGLIRFGTMLEGNEAARTRQIIKQGAGDAHILDGEGALQKFYDSTLEPLVEWYNEIGNRGEEINRMSLYDQMIKSGKGHAEAALAARDLMDFSLQGSFTSVRFLAQVLPFFNARLQGMYKLGRATKENREHMAIVAMTASLAGLALMAYAAGDDDRWKKWKKREEWDKASYWWFSIGDTEFRIPKPFELGAVAHAAERSVEAMFDTEKNAWGRAGLAIFDVAKNQLAMNPTPQAFKPIWDVYANKDGFTKRPIESMSMQRLDSEQRFNSNTSMPARWMSKMTGGALSPVQYDYLVKGYFSWLGGLAVGTADMAARSVNNEPTKPALDYWKFATGGMVQEEGSASSRYVSMVYDQAKQLEEAYATHNALRKEGKIDEAKEYKADHADELRDYKKVENLKKQLTSINERIKMTEKSDLHPAEKRIKIRDLKAKASDISEALSR